MKRLILLCPIVLTVLILISGCPQTPEGGPVGPSPDVGIYTASHVVMAGSSFIVRGEFFPTGQKVWAKFEWQASDSNAVVEAYCEPDEDGTIHAVIRVPEDIVPGDYEVEVYLGKHLDDRELIATLPIHVKAMEE
jgi:hypothetical protein